MAEKASNKRVGDVLGVSDAASAPVRNGDPGVSPSDEAQRRRHRMSEGADELTPTASDLSPHRSSGATGIDMGSGGEGTDLE